MCSACMTIWPAASNRPVEASRRSFTLAEWAERTSTTPISSHAARSAPTITWSVTGSMSAALHPEAAARRARGPAGRHDHRGLGQLDDRGPGELVGDPRHHLHRLLFPVEQRLALAPLLRVGVIGRWYLRLRQRRRHAHRHEL